MYRLLLVAFFFMLLGCSLNPPIYSPGEPEVDCSKQNFDLLEKNRADAMVGLDEAFVVLKGDPSAANTTKKDEAAMAAATAASDLDYARMFCEHEP